MVERRPIHYRDAKHVLQYLKDTVHYGLRYARGGEMMIHGFVDSDWAGGEDNRKSTSGCCFSLGSRVISLLSGKQGSIAISPAEVEYMAVSASCCEAIWICKLIAKLTGEMLEPTVIYYGNQPCIKLSENPMFHDCSKPTVI